MEREGLIERIRKLLAMTERAGCTQAEAVQAALMAQKLIADNDVSADELHGATDGEPIERALSGAATRFRDWAKPLLACVATAFRCKGYFARNPESRYLKPCFLGHATDAKAAVLVFDRLYKVGSGLAAAERDRVRAARRRAAAERGEPEWYYKRIVRDMGASAYDSFCWGFLAGVCGELAKQTAALMLTTPKDVAEEFGSLKLKSCKPSRGRAVEGDHYKRGAGAGRDAVRAGRIGQGAGYALTA